MVGQITFAPGNLSEYDGDKGQLSACRQDQGIVTLSDQL